MYRQEEFRWPDAAIKLLLNKGADKETKDRDGRDAASFAAENEHEIVLKLLEQNNAKMEEDLGRGAFSAYRYIALQNDKLGRGPLEKYFAGEKMDSVNAGIFAANMYLAEDRILCFELVSKRKCHWILQYVKSATGETDVPDTMAELILQRRRWLNGSFFAAIYAITHFYQLFRSGHSILRQIAFLIELSYQTVSMFFAWFAIGNFYLVFRILTTSLGADDLLGNVGRILAEVFQWLYAATLLSCFVLAFGNRPQGSGAFYMTMVVFWVFIMAYVTQSQLNVK
jgi:chitin synthase